MLFALAGEEIGIPGKLLRHVRGDFRSTTVQGVEEGHGSRPAKPVTRIVEVGLAAVHHAVPIPDEIAGGVLEELVTAVQVVESIEQAPADHRERLRYSDGSTCD